MGGRGSRNLVSTVPGTATVRLTNVPGASNMDATRTARSGVHRGGGGRARPCRALSSAQLQPKKEVIGMMTYAQRMDRLGTETAFEVLARAKGLEAQGRAVLHFEIG